MVVAETSPPNTVVPAATSSWVFDLSGDQITPQEQTRLQSDLVELGGDPGVWDVYNAVLETGTPHSRPLVLRAVDNGSLIGIALIYECRKTGECFFDPPLSTLMNLPGRPTFVWFRYGITVDHFTNPGFVAEGVDRHQFVQQAVDYLLRQYLYGTIVEYRESPALPGAVRFPFVDSGVIDLDGENTINDYLERGKNLSRKLKKFRNKGGEIRIIEGAMPPDFKSAALAAFDTLNIAIPTPFQDNYLNMAGRSMSSDNAKKVHIVALLDNEYAGHQSFCRSGNALHCQAGAFDRSRKSTYHAYENIIVSSVDYAIRHGLQRIDYGPVINETKAKMMTGFVPCENRTYARYRPIAAAIPLMLKRSKISPDNLAAWCDLGDEARLAFR